VEGVHFDLAFCSYFDLGRKAVAVNASDIAAMGGRPTHFLVSLGLTPRQGLPEIAALYRGMQRQATDVALVGGNLSASPKTFWVSITMVGAVKNGTMVARAGAKAGDRLYVTGRLGDAAAGLSLLKRGEGRAYPSLVRRWRTPDPRLAEGALLAEEGVASAMMDLSDGLSTDLLRLAEQSGVGVEIDLEQIPLSPSLRRFSRQTQTDPYPFALHGGEDYELLFAVPENRQKRLDRLIGQRKIEATPIGRCLPKKRGCLIRIGQNTKPLVPQGYDHFADA
jgi:thiamine-monophosphate kinase